jgi:WD40 repeat protein
MPTARFLAIVIFSGAVALSGGCRGRTQDPIRPDASQAARRAPGPPSSAAPPASAPPPAADPDTVSAALWLVAPRRWAIAHGAAVSLVDPETGAATEIAPHAGLIGLISTTPQGDRLVFTAGDSHLGVWGSDGVPGWSVPGVKTAEIQAIGLAPGGDRVAAQEGDRLRVWAAGTGSPAVDVESPGQALQIVFHADRRHLLIASPAGVAALDLASKTFDGRERGTDTGGTFVTTLSPDGQWTAAGASGGHALRVWRTLPWAPVATLGQAVDCQNHISAAFSADGQHLLGNSGEAWRRAFAVGSWRAGQTWKPRPDPLLSTTSQLSDDGQTGLLVTDEHIQAVDARSGAVLGAIPHEGWRQQQLSPDGRWLLVYGDGYAIHEARGMRRTARSPRESPTGP